MTRIGETTYRCGLGHTNIVYLLMNQHGDTFSGSNMDYCSSCDEPTTGEMRVSAAIEILDQALADGLIQPEYHRQRVTRLKDEGIPGWGERMAQAIQNDGLANRIE